MLNIVLFGPPGAGKGTQSEMIIRRYNLQHLSTGDHLRSAIAKKTKLGMEAKMYMDKAVWQSFPPIPIQQKRTK